MTIKGIFMHPQVVVVQAISFDFDDVVCYISGCDTKY